MKISRNWLQEFVELPVTLTPAEFSRTLTLSVCEVEGVEVIGEPKVLDAGGSEQTWARVRVQ